MTLQGQGVWADAPRGKSAAAMASVDEGRLWYSAAGPLGAACHRQCTELLQELKAFYTPFSSAPREGPCTVRSEDHSPHCQNNPHLSLASQLLPHAQTSQLIRSL